MNVLKSKTALVALFLFVTAFAFAQPSQFEDNAKKYKNRYKDQLELGEKIEKSWYHYVTTKTADDKYVARFFYPETKQILSYVQYKSDDYKIKSGIAKYWNEDGVHTSEGFYKDDNQVGLWKFYDRKMGTLRYSGTYRNGKRSGIWTNLENGDTTKIYSYFDGLKEGPFIEYDSLGNIENEGFYKSDTIYSQTRIAQPIDTTIVETMPMFDSPKCEKITDIAQRKKCAETEMLQYIYGNLKYPKMAQNLGLEGRAILQFVVNKKGEVEDIIFISSICLAIKKECLKVVEGMPNWIPGTQNGEPVKVLYTLPISFRLEN